MIDKKEIKKKYKESVPPMGVYQIRNKVNGKIFIGSSKNLHGKSNGYNWLLRDGKHFNAQLQKDYNEYGADNFLFEIVDKLEPKDDPNYKYDDDLKVLEELWLEKLLPYDEKGYNKRSTN